MDFWATIAGMGEREGNTMNGPCNYYPSTGAPPILVQVENDWVYSLHFEYTYHISTFPGRFVQLVEQPSPPPPINYTQPVIVSQGAPRGEVGE